MSQSEVIDYYDPISLRYFQKTQALLSGLSAKTYEERIPHSSFLQSVCRTPKESECSDGGFCKNDVPGKMYWHIFYRLNTCQSLSHQKRKAA